MPCHCIKKKEIVKCNSGVLANSSVNEIKAAEIMYLQLRAVREFFFDGCCFLKLYFCEFVHVTDIVFFGESLPERFGELVAKVGVGVFVGGHMWVCLCGLCLQVFHPYLIAFL